MFSNTPSHRCKTFVGLIESEHRGGQRQLSVTLHEWSDVSTERMPLFASGVKWQQTRKFSYLFVFRKDGCTEMRDAILIFWMSLILSSLKQQATRKANFLWFNSLNCFHHNFFCLQEAGELFSNVLQIWIDVRNAFESSIALLTQTWFLWCWWRWLQTRLWRELNR